MQISHYIKSIVNLFGGYNGLEAKTDSTEIERVLRLTDKSLTRRYGPLTGLTESYVRNHDDLLKEGKSLTPHISVIKHLGLYGLENLVHLTTVVEIHNHLDRMRANKYLTPVSSF